MYVPLRGAGIPGSTFAVGASARHPSLCRPPPPAALTHSRPLLKVRLNFTGSVWDEHPAELVGGWDLLESDDASLLASTEILLKTTASGSAVTLEPGGACLSFSVRAS